MSSVGSNSRKRMRDRQSHDSGSTEETRCITSLNIAYYRLSYWWYILAYRPRWVSAPPVSTAFGLIVDNKGCLRRYPEIGRGKSAPSPVYVHVVCAAAYNVWYPLGWSQMFRVICQSIMKPVTFTTYLADKLLLGALKILGHKITAIIMKSVFKFKSSLTHILLSFQKCL